MLLRPVDMFFISLSLSGLWVGRRRLNQNTFMCDTLEFSFTLFSFLLRVIVSQYFNLDSLTSLWV